MAIEKTLLLKGLAGVAALGGVGGVGGVVIKNKLDERAAEEKKKEDEQNKQKELEDKKKEVNDKLTVLGLESCLFGEGEITDSTTFSKDCKLDKTKFSKIHFSNRGDNNVSVTGWTGNNTVKLTISNKPGEEKGIKFLFGEVKDDLTITGGDNQDNKFSIKANKKTEFEEKENKLSKKVNKEVSNRLKTYNTKFGNLSIPASCRFDETEDEKKLECDIKESELKNIKFSNKGDSDSLTLKGLNDSDKIKLIIERSGSGDSESLKYKFKNDSSSKIFLTGTTGDQTKFSIKASSETEFEENSEGKLKKKFDDTVSQKLKNYNDKLGNLKLPDDCRFDITESDTLLECSIDKDQIKTIKFSNKGEGNLTISDGSDFTGLKLNISESGSNLKFNFKSGNKKIKLTNGNKHVFIKKDEENEFKINAEALHKVLSSNVSELAKKVDLVCEYGDSGDGGTCKLDDGVNLLNISQGASTGAVGIKLDESDKRNKVKFTFQEDQSNYEGGVKFTFKGNEISNGGAKLENNKDYEIKTNDGISYLSKKTR